MLKRKLSQPDYFLIAANLLPVVGALFLGWDPNQVFMVYCLETVVIGIFNLIKMGIVTGVRKTDLWYNKGMATQTSGIVFMLFFLMHYGLFVTIQTGLFIQVSGIGKTSTGFFDFFLHWPDYLGPDAYIMLGGFAVSYFVKLVWEFLRTGEYKRISMMKLMFQPYLRIFIQQFTVILGGIFLSFGAGKIFLIIFAVIKTWIELGMDYDKILDSSIKELEREKKF
jgi:hypothetical protein